MFVIVWCSFSASHLSKATFSALSIPSVLRVSVSPQFYVLMHALAKLSVNKWNLAGRPALIVCSWCILPCLAAWLRREIEAFRTSQLTGASLWLAESSCSTVTHSVQTAQVMTSSVCWRLVRTAASSACRLLFCSVGAKAPQGSSKVRSFHPVESTACVKRL